MADAPRDNIDGYHRVMEVIKAQLPPGAPGGPGTSPQSWLANQLGVARQNAHFWATNDGIPVKHLAKVAKLTGLSPAEIRSENAAVHGPGTMFDQIAKQARQMGVSFGDHFISIIRRGLKLNQ